MVSWASSYPYELCDGNGYKELWHCLSHMLSQGVPSNVFYGGLVTLPYIHCHSVRHTSGKYNYHVSRLVGQKPYILAHYIGLAETWLIRHAKVDGSLQPSFCAIWRVPSFLLQPIMRFAHLMGFYLWASPLRIGKFWHAFLAGRLFLYLLAYPSVMLLFSGGLTGIALDYYASFYKWLHKSIRRIASHNRGTLVHIAYRCVVFFSYLYYNMERIGSKPK